MSYRDPHRQGFAKASSLLWDGRLDDSSSSSFARQIPGVDDEDLNQEFYHGRSLDAFDRELLAAEPINDRRWQASQGLARLSLPSKPLATPNDTSTNRQRGIRQELHLSPTFNPGPFSSPSEMNSSPTVIALHKRQNRYEGTETGSRSLPAGKNTKTTMKSKSMSASDPTPPTTLQLGHAPPIVQGISLVSRNRLSDRLRTIFPFPLFNAVQSKCFPIAFDSDENIVLSAPTGSGKTVIMELAICRLMRDTHVTDFKIVYQAPTKALCAERCQDWQTKFASLDLQCAELTGDTDAGQIRKAQGADIIVTTPEKWDSITRRWKDHAKLMQMIKLFLIDEVHILKESRGATLEAVVSRMKSTGSSVRFIALSATVPNSEDVATWLGLDSSHPNLPAHCQRFGEEFRPVQLKRFVYGYPIRSNNFVLDSVLEAKLPEIIARHSNRKPIIIFCPFRKSCSKTAKRLAQLWMSTMPSDRLWSGPRQTPSVADHELRQLIPAGVAFHHAGLDVADRRTIEQGFLSHDISIICCTSTLAVGVNLPCHLVIIKGTMGWTDSGLQEYSDLETMQMLGRAGRPQFEQSASAVILTREERVAHYNSLVSGEEPLESSLHLNLIDHLNAEIGLGTVTDLTAAKRWLGSTFLYVRLGRNPGHYRIEEDISKGPGNDILEQICTKDIALLQDSDLVSQERHLKCTEYGDAMSRYYIKFETMSSIMALPPRAKMSEILSVVAQACEFRDIRLKSGEKSLFKQINKDLAIKFPIRVDIALPAHKVSLLLQAELGGLEFPLGEQFTKHKAQFQQDKTMVLLHINRLIRCIIDCQLTREDSVAARHALELARSFAAGVWDNSPLQLKQLEQIGNVAVRKLANAGINSIEGLENTEAHRLEGIIGKGPPFGMKLLSRVAQFPRLRVSIQTVGKESQTQRRITARAEVGFLNEKVPAFFRNKPIHVCFLAETSDGQVVEFRRFAASKLQNGQQILFSVELTKASQYILVHVMCDEIAGTCRSAELRPDLPKSLFPSLTEPLPEVTIGKNSSVSEKKKENNVNRSYKRGATEDSDGGVGDEDLLAAETLEVVDIDEFDNEVASLAAKTRTPHPVGSSSRKKTCTGVDVEKRQLENGRWACNHKCKDKSKCKHMCCREGLDRPPKPPKQVNAVDKIDGDGPLSSTTNVLNKVVPQSVSGSLKEKTNPLKSEPKQTTIKSKTQNIPASKEANHLKKLHDATTPAKGSSSIKPKYFSNASHVFEADSHSASMATQVDHQTNKSPSDENEFDQDWPDDIDLDDLEDLLRPSGSSTVVNGIGGTNTETPRLPTDLVNDTNHGQLKLSSGYIGQDKSGPKASNSSESTVTSQLPTSKPSHSSHDSYDRSDWDFDSIDGIDEDVSHDFTTDLPDQPPAQTDLSTAGELHVPDGQEALLGKLFYTSPEKTSLGTVQNSGTFVTNGTLTSSRSGTIRSFSPQPSTTIADSNMPDRQTAESNSGYQGLRHEVEAKKAKQKQMGKEKVATEVNKAEEQKILMDGIDPAFYEQFKDFVELI